MNAEKIKGMLRFIGGMPMLILRDHYCGRVKVFKGNEWIATVVPSRIHGLEYEAVLLSMEQDFDHEWRGSYAAIAVGISALQQTGEWDAASVEFDRELDAEAAYS